MIKYSINQIKLISEEQILFIDGFCIEFSDCINGFKNAYPDFRINTKCVAERNILGKPCYFCFYTKNGQIEVIFDGKGFFSNKRNIKSFFQFQKQLNDLGYTSFDLT